MPRTMTAALAAAALLASTIAAAQAWPTQPVKVIVPFSPGTGPDILARTLQPKLTQMWGQAVVVENKPGASGNLGAYQAVKSPPDGYTLVLGASTLVINKTLYRNMQYDPLTELEPIGLTANASLLLVAHPKLGITTAADLIAQAKAKPGAFVYGSPGIATPHHMAMELFKLEAKVSITHIPFSGTAGAVNAVLSGDVPLMFLPVHVAMAQVKGGRLVVLAAAGNHRSTLAPDVPTLAELGYPGVLAELWYGMLAPAATPREIVARVHDDMTKALALAEVKSALAAQGMEVAPSSPDEMAALMRRDAARWAAVVKRQGIKAQ
jgi:tripartite-type tricarboxylate transporter receptor subunit TctC